MQHTMCRIRKASPTSFCWFFVSIAVVSCAHVQKCIQATSYITACHRVIIAATGCHNTNSLRCLPLHVIQPSQQHHKSVGAAPQQLTEARVTSERPTHAEPSSRPPRGSPGRNWVKRQRKTMGTPRGLSQEAWTRNGAR